MLSVQKERKKSEERKIEKKCRQCDRSFDDLETDFILCTHTRIHTALRMKVSKFCVGIMQCEVCFIIVIERKTARRQLNLRSAMTIDDK